MEKLFFIIIIFYSIVLHEVAHGYAAYRNGDLTAFHAGRLTLNPISHIDRIGSIVVPIIAYFLAGIPFGWAKPVPYNPNNVKHKKYAELEIAAAGVLTNIFIAILAVIIFYILKYFGYINSFSLAILKNITIINLFLAMFNSLPFPPADGFSIFTEIIHHSKDFFLKIKNFFSKRKEIEVKYLNEETRFRNKMHNIKAIFSNPLLMILIIFLAVRVFALIVPFIYSFIGYLYSF